MSYRVTLTATAVKERKRLPHEVRQRIDATLKTLVNTPRPAGARKIAGGIRDWRVRIDDYRILYEVEDDESQITVWRIAHRREA